MCRVVTPQEWEPSITDATKKKKKNMDYYFLRPGLSLDRLLRFWYFRQICSLSYQVWLYGLVWLLTESSTDISSTSFPCCPLLLKVSRNSSTKENYYYWMVPNGQLWLPVLSDRYLNKKGSCFCVHLAVLPLNLYCGNCNERKYRDLTNTLLIWPRNL